MFQLNRRQFLRVSALSAAASLAAACTAPGPTAVPVVAPGEPPGPAVPQAPAAPPTRYQEAPALAALVDQGLLPPVDERLPAEPLVLTPVESIGTYGGSWTSMKVGEGMSQVHMTNWVENFVKWKNDVPGSGHRPNVLTSWEWNDDATTITLHFRRGMRWSDGAPLTVDDWLFSWFDMALDDNVPFSRQTGTFVGEHNMEVERIDDYTVALSWPVVNPLFIEVMSRGVGNRASGWQIVPAHYLKQYHYKYNKEYTAADTADLVDRFTNREKYPDMPHIGPWITKEVRFGERIILERNPYYWKVDPEGKQLPYMDEMQYREVQNPELLVLASIEGEIDFLMRGYMIKDVAVLKENEEKGNYEIRMWQQGDVAATGIDIHYCYPDTSIADLLWDERFRRAMSVAIDRQRILDVVFLGLARIRQKAMYSSGPEFQSERGQRILKEWESRWTEHDPDQAMAWLDEIGVVDVDGDGFREKPDGTPLELIIDVDVKNAAAVESMQLVQDDFSKVGLRLSLNVCDATMIAQRIQTCELMMNEYGGAASGLYIAQGYWAPVEDTGYTITGTPYGKWYQTGGKAGLPPPPGSFIEKLQDAYTRAISISDEQARHEATLDGYELHLEHGPIMIGIVGERRMPVLVRKNLKNVPQDGLIGSGVYGYPGTADPEQWYWA